MMIRALFFLFLGANILGCSLLKSGGPPNQFVIEKPFVRDTLSHEFLKGRRIHRFQPILMKDLVIAANGIDGIMAYHRQTGFEKWRLYIKDGVEGGATLEKGRLYFGAGDGRFYCVDARRGVVIWSSLLKSEGLSQPTIVGDRVFVLSGNNVARALNKDSGQLIWVYDRQDRSNFSIRGGSQPSVDGNRVFIGFSDGFVVALSQSSGQILWETNINPEGKRFKDVDAKPVVSGKDILVSSYDGALYSLNKESGNVQWRIPEGGYDEVELAGKVIFYSTTSGKVIAADKLSGKIHWETQLKGNLATSPTYTQGLLIVGEYAGGLVFLDPMNGSVIKRFEPGMGVNSKATLDPKTHEVYFMSGDANLYGLKFTWNKYRNLWPWQRSL